MFNSSEKKSTLARTKILVECALLISISFVLSYFTIFKLPQGGSVTLVSMLGLILIGLRHGVAWGIGSSIVFSGLQMLQGLYAPPAGTAMAFLLMLVLDYIVAFGVMGLAGLFKNNRYGIFYAVILCHSVKFLCHFTSGIILWSSYAAQGQAAWIYSAGYNLTVFVEMGLCLVVSVCMQRKSFR